MGLLNIFRRKKPEEEFYGPPPGYPGAPPPEYGPMPPPPAYGPPAMPPQGMPPTAAVREMGIPSPEMLETMEAAGAPPPGIPPGMPPPPPPYPIRREEPRRLLAEDIEAITESVVADRWKAMTKDFSEIINWKEKAENDVSKLKDRLDEIESKIEGIEKSMLERIDEYSKGVSNISVEIQAIQKVFKATMPEFTSRVKELSALVERVKTAKPKKAAKKKSSKRKKR